MLRILQSTKRRSGQRVSRRAGADPAAVLDALGARLGAPSTVLLDVVVPGVSVPVDQVVVAPSGVWLLDLHTFDDRIEARPADDSMYATRQLVVQGRRARAELDLLAEQHARVCQMLSETSLVFRAMAFGEELDAVPFQADGILCGPPAYLAACISRDGHLDEAAMREIVGTLC
jgi:hypothetical protein